MWLKTLSAAMNIPSEMMTSPQTAVKSISQLASSGSWKASLPMSSLSQVLTFSSCPGASSFGILRINHSLIRSRSPMNLVAKLKNSTVMGMSEMME